MFVLFCISTTNAVLQVSLNQTQSSDIPLWDIRYFKKVTSFSIFILMKLVMIKLLLETFFEFSTCL